MKLDIDKVCRSLSDHTKFLYQRSAIARKGYFDIAYEYILNNEVYDLDKETFLKDIRVIHRSSSYRMGHEGKTGKRTNREEEWIVLDMFQNSSDPYRIFGTMIDYQIPLKGKLNDTGVGKIDFVSETDKEIMLVEIKAPRSTESILKAIIEVQTYYQQINKQKFLDDYQLPQKPLQKIIAIFETSVAYSQLDDERVLNLLRMFNIRVVVLKQRLVLDKAKEIN